MEEDDSRDIGGIWAVAMGHKAKRSDARSTALPRSNKTGTKHQGKWTPIDDTEESSAGDINSMNLVR